METQSRPATFQSCIFRSVSAFIVSSIIFAAQGGGVFASDGLFSAGFDWKLAIRGKGAVANDTPVVEQGVSAVKLAFDFENVEEGELSVWVGLDGQGVELQEGSSLSFRISSDVPCVIKFSVIDSEKRGHDVMIPIESTNGWQDQSISLDYSSFTTHWGPNSAEKQISYPIVSAFIGVVRAEGYPLKGVVTFADPAATKVVSPPQKKK